MERSFGIEKYGPAMAAHVYLILGVIGDEIEEQKAHYIQRKRWALISTLVGTGSSATRVLLIRWSPISHLNRSK